MTYPLQKQLANKPVELRQPSNEMINAYFEEHFNGADSRDKMMFMAGVSAYAHLLSVITKP